VEETLVCMWPDCFAGATVWNKAMILPQAIGKVAWALIPRGKEGIKFRSQDTGHLFL
jgi:hypothetical protein